MTAPVQQCQLDMDSAFCMSLRLIASYVRDHKDEPALADVIDSAADIIGILKADLDESERTVDAFGQVSPQQYHKEIAALKSQVEQLTKALERIRGMFGPSRCFSGCKCWRCQMNFEIDRALAMPLEQEKTP